jgi:hypothetical protein
MSLVDPLHRACGTPARRRRSIFTPEAIETVDLVNLAPRERTA